MKTITEIKNRFSNNQSSEKSNSRGSTDTFLWHLSLFDKISENDQKILNALTPNNCSIFLMSNKKIIFHSENLSIKSIQNEIHFSHDATYVQKIVDDNQRQLRVLTIPFDDKNGIGLVSATTLNTSTELEDSFLHNVTDLQKKYLTIKNSIETINQITKSADPLLIFNRTDGQLLTSNDSTTSFFSLSQKELLNESLQSLQSKFPKATQRKMHISNRTIGTTDCSVVHYTLISSDTFDINTIAQELQEHTEHLIKQYRELQTIENADQKTIQRKIAEVNKIYTSLVDYSNNRKK